MRSKQDGRRCECVLQCRPEEGFGDPLRNPTFPGWLGFLPQPLWPDPPDACAAAGRSKPTGLALDQSHRCDTIPRRDTRRLLLVPARPHSRYARASALPPDNPRYAARLLLTVCVL